MPALEAQVENGLSAVVAMGASAGGLEPLHAVLRTFPLGHGVCFIVVQHLAPTHPSALPALLQSGTALHVQEAQDAQPLEPDRVYVIAPGTTLSVAGGCLRVAALAPELPVPPGLIDVLFGSLAVAYGQRAVGVVLSGMGSDGSAGLRRILEHGGLGLVQTPQSAQFDSMPSHAAAVGLGVRVGSLSSLTAQILLMAGAKKPDPPTPPGPADALDEGVALPAILLRLAQVSGHDFSQYKPTTILRRIERRMAIHACTSLSGYQQLLQASDQEAQLLFKEVLIGVTEFFRDPPVWQHLARKVLPDLVARAADRGTPMLRAWVVGCSTGEEAYSLGMLLTESLDALPAETRPAIQIFASDLSADAIQAARRGLYPDAIARDLSAERLARFFVRAGESWRVSKALRDRVLFARHDLLSDAPFTRLDLLCCRNLLIYLNSSLQQRVLPLFHYVLLSGGHLVLGNAETIGRFDSAFSALDAKLRIYLRRDVQLNESTAVFPVRPPTMSTSPALPSLPTGPDGPAAKAPALPAALQDLADRLMLAEFAPPAVLVDAEGNIVYVSGRTGRFLEPAAGKANWNVHVMAREGLRIALGDALRQLRATPGRVDSPGLVVDTGGGKTGVDLSVRSVDLPGHEGLALAIFREFELQPRGGRRRRGSKEAERQPQLEEQLQSLREEMRCSQEELQSTNEELQSTNEELQSTNEELQSANEELTTSKEEMQAMNEELQTVNAELMSRLQELALAQSDLKNLLNSTQIATLFLDGALNVRRFTEEARKVISLRESDVGRPLADLTSTLDYPALPDDIAQVLRTMEFCERAVPTQDGRWFSVRIMPYRTQDNVIDGSVLTFVDITRAKQLEARLRLAGG